MHVNPTNFNKKILLFGGENLNQISFMFNNHFTKCGLAIASMALAFSGCKEEIQKPEPVVVIKSAALYSSFNSPNDPRIYRSVNGNSNVAGIYYGTSGHTIRASTSGDVNGDGISEF